MIFDVIISLKVQKLGNLRPLVPVLQVKLEDLVVFILAPAVFLYVWIQVVCHLSRHFFPIRPSKLLEI